jgi:hypothetical protein
LVEARNLAGAPTLLPGNRGERPSRVFLREVSMTNTDLGGAPMEPRPGGAGGTDASVSDMAKSAVRTVAQETASFRDSAKDKALAQVEQKTQSATEKLGDFANAIRKAGDELAQHDQSIAGRIAKQAADGLESLSRTVSDKRPEELLEAVRGFGRSNPTAFIAGSILLGVALGRFAKSSEQHGGAPDALGEVSSGDFGSPMTAAAVPMPQGQEIGEGLGDGFGGSETRDDLSSNGRFTAEG